LLKRIPRFGAGIRDQGSEIRIRDGFDAAEFTSNSGSDVEIGRMVAAQETAVKLSVEVTEVAEIEELASSEVTEVGEINEEQKKKTDSITTSNRGRLLFVRRPSLLLPPPQSRRRTLFHTC
jgi:hypothetical protein